MYESILFIIMFITILFIFYLLNNLLKNKVYENYQGIITNNFYTELEKLGYTVNKDDKTIIYNDKTISYNKHFNSELSIKNANNKIITSSILLKNNIPIPHFLKIDFSDSSNIIYDNILKSNIKFPVVIKPINGTFGIDVMTDIETFEELDETISFLKTKYKDAMLEEQISGDCYRIFVFNNKIIDVINREKPYIIGNGTNTVSQLIDIRNEEQDTLNLLRIKNVSELYLKKQGFILTDIPPIDKKIFISNVINMHNGARIARIPVESIPQKNIDLFLKVNKAMDINCSGLDFLSDDITIEYDVNNGHILEVNGTPDTEIHQKIDGYNFFEKFVSSIF